MSRTVLCTPLRVEQAVLHRAGRSMRLVHTGMGPRHAAATAAALSSSADPVLVAGVGGGLEPQVRPGDVVVASEVRDATRADHALRAPSAPLLAGALRRLGLTVHIGPVSSVSRIARALIADGSLAVDMESAQLAGAGVPFAVVRAIVDTIDHPLWQVGTLHRGVSALRTLRACRPALEWWAAATGPREVLLAAPRSSCAGAARAISGQVDLVLVLGSPHSSHSVRLMEVAQREGVPAYLVEDVSEIDLGALAGARRLGIIAGASAPPHLVDQIVHCLGGLGPVSTIESRLIEEDVTFALPREVV
jgi:4-hydroxy-3-methylbut-2-en-1-yl diphosphate reductase